MIPRYSRPDMVAIWSPETRFRIWFEIEAHAADAMAKLGIVIERIKPGHPQQNGRHERFHLTLQTEATQPPAETLREQGALEYTVVVNAPAAVTIIGDRAIAAMPTQNYADLIHKCNVDDEVKVVVIRGEGQDFGDLHRLGRLIAEDSKVEPALRPHADMPKNILFVNQE